MNIEWRRVLKNHEETLSVVTVDGLPMGFGLEDEHRDVKVSGETRIPAGNYDVRVRTAGSISPRYAKRFPAIHEGMLWLQDVPGFEWIYIHMGNTDDHSEGCLLIAEQARINAQGRMTTPNSAPAYERLYQAVVGAAKAGELTIKVIDDDGEGE